MRPEQADTVVIGAGVVGLAVARALALAGREVLVLEANPGIGMETSSRNSEVIHAGLYYPPGSLKAQTCIAGARALYAYCEEKGVPHRRCGKLVLAIGAEQVPRLEALRDNALACGVRGLAQLDAGAIAEQEPEVRAEAALWSPDSGIVDSHALMLALQADLEAAGGVVALNSRVRGGRVLAGGFELQIDTSTLQAKQLVNAAGLHAQRVAASLQGFPPKHAPKVHYARGQYYALSGKAPFSRLVYPLPQDGGLGIHATPDLAGQIRFGPDFGWVDEPDHRFDATALPRFIEAIRRWYPGLDECRLQPAHVGIRPRLAGPGEDFADFRVDGPELHGVPGMVNLFGIESPGLTACLALAEEVCARIECG